MALFCGRCTGHVAVIRTLIVEALIALGRFDDASDQLQEVMDTIPNYPPALLWQATLLIRQQRQVSAQCILLVVRFVQQLGFMSLDRITH